MHVPKVPLRSAQFPTSFQQPPYFATLILLLNFCNSIFLHSDNRFAACLNQDLVQSLHDIAYLGFGYQHDWRQVLKLCKFCSRKTQWGLMGEPSRKSVWTNKCTRLSSMGSFSNWLVPGTTSLRIEPKWLQKTWAYWWAGTGGSQFLCKRPVSSCYSNLSVSVIYHRQPCIAHG